MTTKLHRYAPDGRYLGWITAIRPLSDYADRLDVDLTTDIPPDAPIGYEPVRVSGSWVLQQTDSQGPTLQALKLQKWADMKAARRNAIQAPLATPFGTFDADEEARANIIQTAHLMQTEAQALAPGQVPTVDFTLADNSVVTLTAGQMVQVALLLAAQIQGAYQRGRTVRALIDAAASPQALQAITWSTP